MPWPPIAIVLIGTAVVGWLIFERDWTMWQAYLLVALAVAGLCGLLLVAVLLLTPREHWEEELAIVTKTFREDWRGLVDLLWRRSDR